MARDERIDRRYLGWEDGLHAAQVLSRLRFCAGLTWDFLFTSRARVQHVATELVCHVGRFPLVYTVGTNHSEHIDTMVCIAGPTDDLSDLVGYLSVQRERGWWAVTLLLFWLMQPPCVRVCHNNGDALPLSFFRSNKRESMSKHSYDRTGYRTAGWCKVERMAERMRTSSASIRPAKKVGCSHALTSQPKHQTHAVIFLKRKKKSQFSADRHV